MKALSACKIPICWVFNVIVDKIYSKITDGRVITEALCIHGNYKLLFLYLFTNLFRQINCYSYSEECGTPYETDLFINTAKIISGFHVFFNVMLELKTQCMCYDLAQ